MTRCSSTVVYGEPTNAYDANAVRVDASDGSQVGYLSREDAIAYRAVFEALATCGRVGTCRAPLIGGTTEKPSIGVVLDLEYPNELLAGRNQVRLRLIRCASVDAPTACPESVQNGETRKKRR